jgi:FkbM family methyltransferase
MYDAVMQRSVAMFSLFVGFSFVGHVTSEICDSVTAARIAASVGHLSNSTGCPDATWKRDFFLTAEVQANPFPSVVLDIGCNKGYDALTTLNLFTQNHSVGGDLWSWATGFDCGVCKQCLNPDKQLFTRQPPAHPVLVYCVEPLPANFLRLNATSFRFKLHERGMQTVFAAATSEEDAKSRGWKADFPRQTISMLSGVETFGIGNREHCPRCPTVSVPLIVLDRFVKQHDIEWVDFLSIDTEGHDSRVLRGANRILEKVRYLEFEYHSIGVWKSTSLREVIAFLEHKGHTCYWIGRSKAWLITGCWHPSYATKRWSNIGCVNRRVPRWAAIMDTVFRSTVSLAS